jgi:hypothetical protein
VGGAVSQQPEINNAMKEDRAKVVYAQDFITYLVPKHVEREHLLFMNLLDPFVQG